MKRISSLCLLSLFLLGLMTSSGHSQSAAEILKKMIEAQGGRKVLENIKDTTISSWQKIPSGGIMTMTMYKKEPNKMRKDIGAKDLLSKIPIEKREDAIKLMGNMGNMMITFTFDGETAWHKNLFIGKNEVPTGAVKGILKREALGYSALLHPEKYGITYAYKGKEEIEDKNYFVLEQTLSDGLKTTLYVDTETYLIYKTKYAYFPPSGEKLEEETFMSDYKKVDGVMIPHSLKNVLKGYGRVEPPTIRTITKVSFNTGLEDSLFNGLSSISSCCIIPN